MGVDAGEKVFVGKGQLLFPNTFFRAAKSALLLIKCAETKVMIISLYF